MTDKNQRGFAHWLLVFIPLVLVMGIGLFVMSQHKKNQTGSWGNGFLSHFTGGDSEPSCPAKAGLLKYSPVPVNKLSTVVPLGNLAPPGHVTPTPHMYYNFIPTAGHNLPQKTDLVVPADMTITKLWLFGQGPTQAYKAYRLDFTLCKQITGYFILIINLPDKLASLAQAPWDQDQASNVGNGIQHNYWKKVNVQLKAGESLGSAGGFEGAPDGLDMGMNDSRVKMPTVANPGRGQQPGGPYVCSLDYYSTDLSKQLYGKLGGFDYVPRDPGEPKCGTVYQDLPGSAQGIWFSASSAATEANDVNAQLTLAHWNLDHSKGVFSGGNNIKSLGLNSSNIYLFTPQQSGSINLDFGLVKPGSVYCYNTTSPNQSAQTTAILIQLTSEKTLKIAKNTSNCGSGPWQIPANSLEYVR